MVRESHRGLVMTLQLLIKDEQRCYATPPDSDLIEADNSRMLTLRELGLGARR